MQAANTAYVRPAPRLDAMVASRMARIDGLTQETIKRAGWFDALGGLGAVLSVGGLAALAWFGFTDPGWVERGLMQWMVEAHPYATWSLFAGFGVIGLSGIGGSCRMVDDALLGRLAALEFSSRKAQAVISREVERAGRLRIATMAVAVEEERETQRRELQAELSSESASAAMPAGAKAWLSAHAARHEADETERTEE